MLCNCRLDETLVDIAPRVRSAHHARRPSKGFTQ
jgi:hypothetical protein